MLPASGKAAITKQKSTMSNFEHNHETRLKLNYQISPKGVPTYRNYQS
jgi:hypothetical protein